jgi:excinuclease ABC subunit A
VQTAFEETNGDVYLEIDGKKNNHFCNRFELDGIVFDEPTPNLFSSNNPYGACAKCEGFGTTLGIDDTLVIPDRSLSVYDGAVACWRGERMQEYLQLFIKASSKNNFPIHKPIKELTKEQYHLLWHGDAYTDGIWAFFKMVEENVYKVQYRVMQSRYRGRAICPDCNGTRLCKAASYVKISNTTIGDINCLPAVHVKTWLKEFY